MSAPHYAYVELYLIIAVQKQIQTRNAELEKTLAERKDQKFRLLESYAQKTTIPGKFHAAHARSAILTEPMNDANVELLLKDAKARIKEHITLLHQYNEIRDIGLGLMGMISDQRGVRLRDVQEEFGVTAKD